MGGVGGRGEGKVQNLSCRLLFSNDLFNNYLCNQRSQGSGEGEGFNPPYPTEQPEKKVNKMPPAALRANNGGTELPAQTHTSK